MIDSKFAATVVEKDVDAQLRADVRAVGSILGRIIKSHEGQDVFDKVEKLRGLAKTWREAGAGRESSQAAESLEAFEAFVGYVASLQNNEIGVISRAFTHFLAITNAAEFHHRSRRNKEDIRAAASREGGPSFQTALSPKRDSCGFVLSKLMNEMNIDPEKIREYLSNQTVELVLTAHPTEVNRRTLLDKHKRVQKLLCAADDNRSIGGTTSFEARLIDDDLHREITSIWQTDEVSRHKPTPQVEAMNGTLVIESVLWEALPSFLRKLDAAMVASLGGKMGLPLDAAPIKLASWMGGDRDGNPNVTPNVTREVCLTNRIKAAVLLRRNIEDLAGKISILNCSDELRTHVGKPTRAPYRDFLQNVAEKLKSTELWAQESLDLVQAGMASLPTENDQIYSSKAALMDDLMLVHRSLCETGNSIIAEGDLIDIIRRVSSFGLALAPLDIRQESDRHMEALDAITRFLGMGSYSQWDEPTRLSWLQKELSSPRPLIRKDVWNEHPEIFSPTAVDTLETFAMIAEQHEESLGAYVISQATSASDVLAVLMLQRDAGVRNPLRVVPLFETLDDLKGAAATMESLFSLPTYRGSIGGKQEVMIGYSDSAKDAGRLAASWAQFETQEDLAKVAAKHSVEMTFFHGKGGTVGRGGNPATFDAILAHAPDTINGRFRVTVQGEMINQDFGHPDRAERSFDIYTAAVLAEQHTTRPTPTAEWRDLMNTLSDISCDAYRKVVREDERFVPFFRSATPELELADLNIGSRPAKRKASGGVESLRAIPWIFAWMQTRLMLPSWLGVGSALRQVLESDKGDKLREMYRDWDAFRTTVDLVEMVLAKSEPCIARHYVDVLVKDESEKELGAELRMLLAATEDVILELTNHKILSENNKLILSKLQVRNPYVDCLNILQAETMKRLRESDNEEDSKILKDALLTTITGVANGMGNTG